MNRAELIEALKVELNTVKTEQAAEAHTYSIQILEHEVDLAELRLEQIKSGLTVEEMRLNVDRLTAQLDDAQIVAPFDGVLLSVGLVEGRAVEAYRPVMVIADPSELEVSADLTDRQMRDLVEGMPAAASPVPLACHPPPPKTPPVPAGHLSAHRPAPTN